MKNPRCVRGFRLSNENEQLNLVCTLEVEQNKVFSVPFFLIF